MRIAILVPEIIPAWGGVGAYTYNLVNNLPKDTEIHLITIDRDIDFLGKKNIWDERIKIHKITKVSSYESFFYNLKFQIAVLKRLKELHKQYHFDLIHSHSGHLPHLFSQFQNIAPMIVTVHAETKGLKIARRGLKYKKDNTEFFHDFFSPVIELGEKINFKKADRLLPISEFTLKQVNQNYHVNINDKARVIYNGVNTELFKPIDDDIHNPLRITFIGRLYSLKGIDILLDALSKISAKGYKLKILLLGRGDATYLETICSSFLDKDSYSILGLQQHYKMPQIYNQSDVIILPSVYEGCSGTILEALSSGKIVIASDVGGTPEIIKHGFNGLLFKSRNSAELTERIIDILEKTVDVNKIKKNARTTAVIKFDWKDKSKEVYQEYLKILHQ
jgi:glycosyltransferase involved in cell wall biosynthesis